MAYPNYLVLDASAIHEKAHEGALLLASVVLIRIFLHGYPEPPDT
jgi:hypothetical protein